MWAALKRLGPMALLAVAPCAATAWWVLNAVHHGSLGVDFRAELYPEAKLVLHGHNPYPPAGSDLSSGVNLIFPVAAAALVIPFTLLPIGAAAAVFTVVQGIVVAASLRLMDVTDWRVYGLVALWPATSNALQNGNMTVFLLVLAAVAWRLRDQTYAPGLAVGAAVALKLFLWPLLLWLAVRGRARAALLGAALSALSLLLVLPFTSLGAYVRLLNRLGDTFTHESYNLPGLLIQSGAAGVQSAKVAGYALGLVVLAVACRRRSFGLTIVASILLSPIVWLHDLELLALPLAAVWKRLSVPWLLPLGLFAVQGTPREVRERHIVAALVVIAAVALVAELAPRARALARDARPVFDRADRARRAA